MPRPTLVHRPPRPARRRSAPASFGALLAAIVAAVLAAHPAGAHEYWLAPSRYLAPAHRPISLGALAGTGFRGERKPFAALRCMRLEVRASRPLDLSPIARDGEYVWARFAPSDDRGALLVFESNFTPITLPAPEFDRYLENEGLDEPLAVRHRGGAENPGRERYRRCAKAWLAGADSARASAPAGLPLEIVPVSTPGSRPRLQVRVLWQGKPLAGALLRAWRAPLATDGSPTDPEARDSVGVAWQTRTDARGEALANVEAPGEWMLNVVHMVPCPDAMIADWESTWASLTFERARAATR